MAACVCEFLIAARQFTIVMLSSFYDYFSLVLTIIERE